MTAGICAQNNAEVNLFGTINIEMLNPTSAIGLWSQRSGVLYLNNGAIINITNSTGITMNDVLRAELGGVISRIAINNREPCQINFSGLANNFVFASLGGQVLLAYYIKGQWTNHNDKGKRFNVMSGSVINTQGRGAEWFPGSEEGTVQEGGLYI